MKHCFRKVIARQEGELKLSETFHITVPISDVFSKLVIELRKNVSSTTPHTISSEPRGVGADRGRRERKRSRPQRLSAVM